jgi:DnaJ-class molecular chaperone
VPQGDEKAAEKFKEASEAYEVLSNLKQREQYDQFGHAGINSDFGGPGGNPFGQGFEGFDFGDGSFHFSGGNQHDIDPEELFEALFGGGRRRNRGPRKGADLQMHVNVSFKEAVFGTTKDLHLRYQLRDPKTGQISVKERDVAVDIPAGIDNGMNLRVSGQGAEGDPGAPSGNLLVHVVVAEDDYFRRDGYDVHTEIPISLTQAVLGGTVDVTTLTGEVEMKIPKGCQVDTKLMLRGKGIQKLNSKGHGNQIVYLKIQIPKTITARQEELLREFDEESGKSGIGISGRLAGAVGSAFSNLFGGNTKDNKKKKTKKDDHDDEEDFKKQAAS